MVTKLKEGKKRHRNVIRECNAKLQVKDPEKMQDDIKRNKQLFCTMKIRPEATGNMKSLHDEHVCMLNKCHMTKIFLL